MVVAKFCKLNPDIPSAFYSFSEHIKLSQNNGELDADLGVL